MQLSTIEEIYHAWNAVNRVITSDTRKEVKGSLFFCLSGDKFNANNFAQKALDSGASFVVTNNPDILDEKVLLVEDPNITLGQLASHHVAKMKAKLICVGGSNGKTTTKELINALLSTRLNVKYTLGNFNNHIGVPLTLLSISEDTDIGIIETGTNHPGEMKYLCDMFNPDSGIITNIGKEHLEGFGDLESVAKEESEVYLRLQQSQGSAFVNLDDPWLGNMSKRLSNKITYSILDSNSDIYLRPIEEMPHLKFEVFIHQESKGIFQTKLGGKFNLYNICAAIACSIKYDIDWDSTIKSIVNFESNNNRSQWIEFGTKKVFLDAYNANPSSVVAGLESFSTIKGSKAVILGDMLELGHHSQKEHLEIFELAVKMQFEELFICGPEFSLANGSYPFKFDSAATLLAWLDTHPIESDYIFVKGSRGMKMETVLEHFKA